jgi:hypothetical protein
LGRRGIRIGLNAATTIDQNIRMDARRARNAVTGPLTAEYGPTGTDKRQVLNTHSRTTRDTSIVKWRPRNMALNYTSLYDIN